MKNIACAIVAGMVVLLSSALPAQAWGGYGGHHGFGGHYGGYGGHHGFGGSYGFGGHYGYPTYGYGYPYRSYAFSGSYQSEQQPTVYVQQQFYWYYCEDANAYYPYVQQCPRGWTKVLPSPTKSPQ